MKILQLISSTGFFGAENVVLELSRELASRQIENIIGVFDNSHNPHCELIRHAQEIYLKTKVFKCDGRVDVRTLYDITRFVKRNQIDILHAHGYKSNIYGFIASKLSGKPIVSTCHNWIADDFKTKMYYVLDKGLLHNFDRVVAVSDDIRHELLGMKVESGKIFCIPNGISIGRYAANNNNGCYKKLRQEFNISENAKIIGTVARFTPEKGLLNLLCAAKEISREFRSIFFMLVGDGPLRDYLKRETVRLGIEDKVIFTGIRSDMPQVYSVMDIFVLPSLKEGVPMVLLEAMAAKRPVIATQVGAVPKIVENGKNGLLVLPDDHSALKEAMMLLLKDTELTKRIALNGYLRVSNDFSSAKMCGRYMDIYNKVMRAHE